MSRLALGTLIAALFALIVLSPSDGFAQCSMCRTALEQNEEAAAGFNRAILFLLAMPYSVFASGAGYVLWSRRRRAQQAAAVTAPEPAAPGIRADEPIAATS